MPLGRIRDRICAYRLVKDGTFGKFAITLFQEIIASGKKLFLFLEVLHLISLKVLEFLHLYKSLRLLSNLSLK